MKWCFLLAQCVAVVSASISCALISNPDSSDFKCTEEPNSYLKKHIRFHGNSTSPGTFGRNGCSRHEDVQHSCILTVCGRAELNLSITVSDLWRGRFKGIICAVDNAKLTVSGGTVTNCSVRDGIIRGQDNATLLLQGVHFVNNRADLGGIITQNMSSLVMSSFQQTSSASKKAGGGADMRGVFATDASTVNISRSSFLKMKLAEREDSAGAGVFAEKRARVNLMSCEFKGNEAHLRGGAVHGRDHSTLSIVDCSFVNSSSSSGAGVDAMDNANISITASNFSGNTAVLRGGAVHGSANSTIFIKNCSFDANHVNSSSSSGAGVDAMGNANISITGSNFSSNIAVFRGGAVHGSDDSTLVLEECSFHGNNVTSDLSWGAGVDGMDNANVTVVKCKFEHNTNSLHLGGALSLVGNVNMVVADSNFSGNVARGGAVFHLNGNSSLSMSKCDMDANEAKEWGGAGYAEGDCNVAISSSNCTNNTAIGSGGCIIAQGTCRLSINDSHINNNTGDNGGGALQLQTSANATLSHVCMIGNR